MGTCKVHLDESILQEKFNPDYFAAPASWMAVGGRWSLEFLHRSEDGHAAAIQAQLRTSFMLQII
jgi:hypothetical protein